MCLFSLRVPQGLQMENGFGVFNWDKFLHIDQHWLLSLPRVWRVAVPALQETGDLRHLSYPRHHPLAYLL